MNIYDTIVTNLKKAYSEIHNSSKPDWAVHKITPGKTDELVHPTIPFVGKYYADQPVKILVYASAENLSTYYKGGWTINLDDDSEAEDRHRRCFSDLTLQKGFFPHVHISPMNNGALATAVFYLATKLNTVTAETPRDFYETIAFANYGKYSIETNGKNIDYAGKQDKLAFSRPLVLADLKNLQPDYIILPKSVYHSDRKFIDSIRGNATPVPICQMNATVINGHIAPCEGRENYPAYDMDRIDPKVRKWFDNFAESGVKRDKYRSVFTYLDKRLEELNL